MNVKDLIFRRRILFLICLVLLGAAACTDFFLISNERRTMVFYTVKDNIPVIEERMIPSADTVEESLTRYVDEVLLGPVDLDTAPLFPEGSRLESLMYRDGDVFINLSETAALPPVNGIRDVKQNIMTFVAGIKRNFASIGKVVFFINGNEVFFDENTGI